MRFIVLVIFALSISSCIKEDSLNVIFETFQPMELGDGLGLSSPTPEGIDSASLVNIYNDVYASEDLWSIRSLLVFRNDRLVSEAYMKDEGDISTQHLVWSCTKQVMGVLAGIAIEKGVISSIDDPISLYLGDELINHADKKDITINDLLTMRSGIDYDNDGSGGQTDKLLRQKPDNSVEFVLDRPLITTPGDVFRYKDGDPHLLSAVIQNATGKPTDVWADEVLFSKLGFENYSWVRYKDGVTFGGFGIVTTPRELSKIAICVANNGAWGTDQIVSSEWIGDMTQSRIEASDDYGFGYYWWTDTARGIHFMWGHGGQFAFIVPSKNLVVVITSIPNTQGDYQIDAEEALVVVDRIIDACD